MAISFVAESSASTAVSVTSKTVNKPTGVVNGDLMIGMFPGVSSTPSGWTLLGSQSSGTSSLGTVYWYYKIAASEGSSYNLTGISGVAYGTWSIIAYRGCDSGTPISGFSKAAGSGTNYNVTVTPDGATQWVVGCSQHYTFGSQSTAGTWTESGTERADGGGHSGSGSSQESNSYQWNDSNGIATGGLQTITQTLTGFSSSGGVKAVLLLNNGSFNGTGNADAPNVTATAYDATTAQGVAAQAGVANLTLGAGNVQPGVQAAIATTCQAWDASVKITASAEVATLSLNSGDKGITYGAPPGRTVKVGAENRTWKIGSENRVYVVEIGAID